MCGLVGFAGKLDHKARKAFDQLLLVDVLRGKHSTGVYGLTSNGLWDVVKKVGAPGELFDSVKYATLSRRDNMLLIGHNRYATQGAVNTTNAHPFVFPDIVGAHNGTLSNQRLLPDHADFEVDSENIFHSIQEDGFADTVGKLQGAYALSWHDDRDNTLNFSRNCERTLYYTTDKDNTQLFWASEAWMLSGVLGRNSIKHNKILSFEVDMHYSFNLAGINAHKGEGIPKPSVRKAVGHVAPVIKPKVITHNKGKKPLKKSHHLRQQVEFTVTNIPYVRDGMVRVEGVTTIGAGVAVFLREAQAANLEVFTKGKKLKGTISYMAGDHEKHHQLSALSLISVPTPQLKAVSKTGYRGEVLSDNEYRRRTIKGCAWCSDKAGDGMEWFSTEEFLCETCSQDDLIAGTVN